MFFLFYAVLGWAAEVRFCKVLWLEDLSIFQNTLTSEICPILNSHTLIKVIRKRKAAKVANFNWADNPFHKSQTKVELAGSHSYPDWLTSTECQLFEHLILLDTQKIVTTVKTIENWGCVGKKVAFAERVKLHCLSLPRVFVNKAV